MNTKTTAERIILIADLSEQLMENRHSLFAIYRAPTLVLKELIKFTGARKPSLSQILEIKDIINQKVSYKTANQMLNMAAEHLSGEYHDNVFQLDREEMPMLELLIDAEYGVFTKENPEETANLFKMLLVMAKYYKNDEILNYIENVRGFKD